MGGFLVFPKVDNYVEIDNVPFSITKKEQTSGLMGVEKPSFMIFLYKNACVPRFWMKDTPLPLDIIFCDANGKIGSIEKGEPFIKKTVEPKTACKIVIEAPFGFCKENGIELDNRVKIKYDKEILNRILKSWSTDEFSKTDSGNILK